MARETQPVGVDPNPASIAAQAEVAAPIVHHLKRRFAAAAKEHIDFRRRAALRMWVAFIVTFVFLRALVYAIRYHLVPWGNVETGSLHIHHFVWGIFVLLIVGFIALQVEAARWHPWLAIPFGIGAALVVDEFALWLNLRDVYFTEEGRWSVDLAVVLAAILGLYYAAACFWRQIVADLRWAGRLLIRGERRLLRHRPSPPNGPQGG
jgi:hypothetical protein